MPTGNTVQARVDLDIGPFRRGLLSAQSELGKFSTKFSAGKVLTSVLQGIGLGSGFAVAEKLAETIAGAITGGSREGWDNALKAAQDYERALETMFLKTRTAAQQAEYWRMEQAKFTREGNDPRRQFGEGEGPNWFIRNSGGALRGLANRFGLFGAETEAAAIQRQAENKTKALQAGAAAAAAEKAQQELNRALQDELEKRQLIGASEGAQFIALRKRIAAADAEAEALDRTDPEAAGRKRLEASRLRTQEAEKLQAIEENHLSTREQLDELDRQQAARMETDTEKINRLRADALRLQQRALDNSRTVAQHNADLLEAQKKLNEALNTELDLRKSNLSVADIASKGGNSTRGRTARRAQNLRDSADRAAARGDFATAERQRGQARQLEEGLQKQERDYLEGKDRPPQSEWDRKYGRELKDRSARMDAGLEAIRARTRPNRMQEAMASRSTSETTPANELKSALDSSSVLKSIDTKLSPESVSTT